MNLLSFLFFWKKGDCAAVVRSAEKRKVGELLPSTVGLILFFLAIFLLIPKFSQASTLAKPANNLGLVGYWSFEDATGTKASDFSGKGNTGTLGTSTFMPTWTGGIFGKALYFFDDFITAPTISVPSDITMSVWMNAPDYSSVGSTIIDKEPENTQWSLFVWYGSIFLRGGGNTNSVTAPAPSPNKWHHIVGVISGTTGTIYIDGVSVGTGTVNALGNGSGIVNIGRGSVGSGYVRGTLDEVRIYNRALSPTEIASLYNSSGLAKSKVATERGLVGYWSFEDASGNAATDFSGKRNTLSLKNSPTWTNGKLGRGVSFNGVDQNASTTLATTISYPVTLSLWVKINSVQTTEKEIIEILGNPNPVDPTDGDFGITYGVNGKFLIWSKDGTNNGYAQPTTTPNVNQWYHLVATANGTNVNLWVDGVLAATKTTGKSPTGLRNLNIGRHYRSDQTRYFDGVVDDARVYNRALSAEEILKLYNANFTAVNRSLNVVAPGNLVAWHTFDGPRLNSTTSTDSSGQGNNGTLVGGPVPKSGKIGQALKFDGVDDYLRISHSNIFDFGTGDFSVSLWMRTSGYVDSGSSLNVLFSNSDNAPDYIGVSLNSSNQIRFDTLGVSTASISTVNDGQWKHVVVTRVGSANTIYIDGVLDNTGVGSAGSVTINQSSYIGRDNLSTRPFNGFIDDVRVYNKALTATEVRQLYNGGK